MHRTGAVFFLSGVAALVYETIWARLLTRVLGSQAGATAVVLALFMLGLGLGALLATGFARRTPRPGRAYAALEASIGLWALATPVLLGALAPVGGFAARALVAGLVLLPPTMLMGATFPLMGRLTVADARATGSETSGFYAANTCGACIGVLLGTCVLMPLLGLRASVWAAALLSGLVAALGFGLRAPQRSAEPAEPGRPRFDPFLFVPALFGLSSLALEVVLTRLLVTVTGASIYAFAIVLTVFLAGIALGSWQAKSWLAQATSAPLVLARCALAVPLAALLGALALRLRLGESDLFASLGNRISGSASPLAMWSADAVLAALALVPPAVAFGAALPACAAVAVARSGSRGVERALGRVYAANTAGALAGSLLAGFVLLPQLGLRGAYLAALAPALLAAFAVPGARKFELWAGAGAALLLAVFVARPALDAAAPRVLFHRAGLYEMVAVEETIEGDGSLVRSIRLNGKVEASTAPVDARLQRMLGHIPGLLHGNVRSALCIGTGTGMTAGSLLDLPALESLTLYEIEPVVPLGTRFFADWNNHLLDDPRLRIVIGDGRHSLFRSTERFDLITADPLHVWSRGSSDLYTLEYYREMARHLAPGGVASQWIGLYELSTRDVRTVLSTWSAAFPHVRAYLTAYDFALIGSNEPFGVELARSELPERVARSLAEVGVYSGAELEALLVADDAALRAFVGDVPPMRDDLPLLEFRAPLSFRTGYSIEVLRWCARPEFVERLPAASRARALEVRALLTQFLDALPQGTSAAAARYGRELLALGPLGAAPLPR